MDAHAEREQGGARHLAGGERRVGQRTESDEFTLRDQDDAGHREDEDERETEQRIDRAARYSVLQQEQKNRAVQDIPQASGNRCGIETFTRSAIYISAAVR